MKKKDTNARSNVRRNLIFYLPIINRENGTAIGSLGDITETGVLIISERTMPYSEKLHIGIELPKGKEYPDRMLDLKIQVQWSKEDPDNPDLALTGCKIISISDEDKNIIKTLIQNVGFSNGQRLVTFNESIADFR